MDMFGCEFIQVYGLTETTGAITQLDAADHDPVGRPELLRSCGKPYPWVEVRIVDSEGVDVGDGEVGELWTRSRQNMLGYWANDEATARAIDSDGWFRTGDAGYRDADGFLYLHDRVKDMIVSGGENIYPAEVENVLAKHPDVVDVAVIGVPDEQVGRSGEGRRRATGRGLDVTRSADRLRRANTSRATSCRSPSTLPASSRATRQASCSSAKSAPRTGKAPTARSGRRPSLPRPLSAPRAGTRTT